MGQYIDKNKIELEIKKHKLFAKDARNYAEENDDDIEIAVNEEVEDVCSSLLSFLDTLEVKEVDEQKERMEECPYRKVGCTMYEGYILECRGACSWVVDYTKLKELKAQKGEQV